MKYLLCRPCGGLNDILCQIGGCYNYCAKYNRILLIDTNHFKAAYGGFSFDKYFTFIDTKQKIIYNTDTIINMLHNELNTITVYPKYI